LNAQGPQPDDEDARTHRANMTVLGIAVTLVVIVLVVLYAWKRSSDLEDCFAANHKNCAPIDTSDQ
jgi:hypothetical protein